MFPRLMPLSLLAVLAAVLVIGGCAGSEEESEPGEVRDAPDFTLPKLGGGEVKLKEVTAKNVVILDFWASWCGFCRKATPDINKLYEKYKGKGVAVYGINLQEDEDRVRDFVKHHKMAYPVLMDRKGETGRKYHILGIPTLVLIDRAGKIRAMSNTVKEIEKALDQLLAKSS